MRRRLHEQLSLVLVPVAHAHARELEKISELLDELPSSALTRVQTDLLSRGDNFVDQWRGREGMTAEQVVRVLIIKRVRQSTWYRWGTASSRWTTPACSRPT